MECKLVEGAGRNTLQYDRRQPKKLQGGVTHNKLKVKSSPTDHVGPEGSRRVKVPSFRDNGTVMVCRLSAVRTGRLYPQEHS